MGPSTLFSQGSFSLVLGKEGTGFFFFFPSLEASKLQPWLFLFPFVPDLVCEDRVIMQDSF